MGIFARTIQWLAGLFGLLTAVPGNVNEDLDLSVNETRIIAYAFITLYVLIAIPECIKFIRNVNERMENWVAEKRKKPYRRKPDTIKYGAKKPPETLEEAYGPVAELSRYMAHRRVASNDMEKTRYPSAKYSLSNLLSLISVIFITIFILSKYGLHLVMIVYLFHLSLNVVQALLQYLPSF